MEPLHAPPSPSQFTPLSTFQSETPSSFSPSQSILYHKTRTCVLKTTTTDLTSLPHLQSLSPHPSPTTQNINGNTTSSPPRSSDEEDAGSEVTIEGVDIWVTSSSLLLFSPSTSKGLSLPYRSITLHALSNSNNQPSLYLQLQPADTFDDHDPNTSISLTLIPPSSPPSQQQQPPAEEDQESKNEAKNLYDALTSCADLHPDPSSDDEMGEGDERILFGGDGGEGEDMVLGGQDGLPPPMPGSGGWITAENMHEFFDEEGNMRGGGAESLGAGAGRVRARDGEGPDAADDGMQDGEGNGDAEREGETKWRRTD